MKDKTFSSFLKKFQKLRHDLSGSLIGKIFHKIKLGRLLVDIYSRWIIRHGFHSCYLLGQNINFRVSSKPEITHIDMAEELEGQLLRRLVDVLQKKDVYYDIGAHIGLTCLPIATLGKSQQPIIFAFEPHPEIFQRLKENISLNDVNIEVYQSAIGQSCGQAKLNISNFGEGTHTIVNSGLRDKRSIEVPVITVGRFVLQGHPSPNLVKIDVEGYEMNVLLGMEKSLKSGSIRHIFVEVHPNLLRVAGHNKQELIDWLDEYGFKITWRMIRGGEVQYQFTKRI